MAGHRGDEQAVRAALTAEEPELRTAALGAALRLKILDIELLLSFLNDPAASVRRRATELAPRLAAAEPELGHAERLTLALAVVELLADADCAEVAAFALGELELTDGAIVAALEAQGVGHEDPLCRESAIAALGALGEGRPSVLAATDDVATVRRRAIIALANFEGPEVEAALTAALEDRDWQVRQAAEDLLA